MLDIFDQVADQNKVKRAPDIFDQVWLESQKPEPVAPPVQKDRESGLSLSDLITGKQPPKSAPSVGALLGSMVDVGTTVMDVPGRQTRSALETLRPELGVKEELEENPFWVNILTDPLTFAGTGTGATLTAGIAAALAKRGVPKGIKAGAKQLLKKPQFLGGKRPSLSVVPEPKPGVIPKPQIRPPVKPAVEPTPDIFDVIDSDQGIIGKGETTGLLGRTTTLRTVNRDIPAKYKVVELDDLIPSHDPHNFAENPKYPKGIQERDYFRDKGAQTAVIRNTQQYDPSFTINNSPGPEHGPPMVTKDGIVLGGNSRTMSTARLYRAGQGDKYREALIREADQYGIGPAEVEKLKQPVLIRELDEAPKTTGELSALGSDLNKVFTRGLSEQEQAVSAGKRVGRGTLDWVGEQLNELGEKASIKSLMRSKPKQILDFMKRDQLLSNQELRKFIDEGSGTLNEAGKDYFENAIMGVVIDDAHLLSSAPKLLLNKVAASLAPLSRLKIRGDQWDLTQNIKEALRIYTAAAARAMKVDDYLDPRAVKLFDNKQYSELTLSMVQKLKGTGKKLKEMFRGIAEDAATDAPQQGALGFIEVVPPEKSIKRWMGVDIPKPIEPSPGDTAAYISKRGGKPPTTPPAPPPALGATIRKSDKVRSPNEPVLAKVDTILRPPKAPPKTAVEKLVAAQAKVQTVLTSEFTPVRLMEKELYKMAGEEAPHLDMARKLEQVAGAAGKAELDLIRFQETVIAPLGKLTDDFNDYLFLRRVGDRLLKDPQRKRVANWTVEEAEEGLRELRSRLGEKNFDILDRVGDLYQAEMDAALRLQVGSGRMSEGLYAAIKKDNDFYTPFHLMKYLETGDALKGAGREIATTADLTKMIKGIKAEDFTLADPLLESSKQIYRSRILAEKNLKMLEIDDLTHLDPEGILMKKLRPTRYFDVHYRPAEEILHQLYQQATARNPQLLEVSLTKVGKALEVAQGAGLHVTKRNMLTALGRAQLGGADFDGKVFLDAFTSEVITHELAHSFDTRIVDASGNIVTKLKNVFGEEKAVIQRLSSAINDRDIHFGITGKKQRVGKRTVFQQELLALTDFTGLGGSSSYQARAVERFAEFVQLYIHDPKQAKTLAPEFTRHFEQKILPNNKIQALVEKLSNFYQEIDGMPNVYSPLQEMNENSYLQLAIRTAFPAEKPKLEVVFGQKARPGYDIVNYYKDGKVQALELQKDVAKAIQGLTRGEASMTSKVAQMAAMPLRLGATGANIAFQPVNLFLADLPRAALMSRYGIRDVKDIVKFPADWLYSFYSSMTGNFGKPNKLYRQFLESGAANSTIQRELTPGVFNPSVLGPRTLKEKLKVRFLDTFPKIANAIEETSKVLGIKRGYDIEGISKMSPEAAAIKIQEIVAEVRNYSGSPDFLRRGQATSGASIENLNLLFMFFNARIQGAASDLARLAGKTGGPEAVNAWLRLGAVVGTPSLTLALYNQTEHEITLTGAEGDIVTTNKAEYAKIPLWERENYFLIPHFDNSYFINYQGERVRNYHKLPKREITKLFGNLIESGVQFAFDKDPDVALKYAMEFLENISPVSIEGETLTERGESIFSSLNPLFKTPLELATERDLFRHRDIIPEYISTVPSRELSPEQQYTSRTPEVFKSVSKVTGMSPLKLEHFVKSATAGLLTQFLPGQVSPGRPEILSAPGIGGMARRFQRSDYTRGSESLERVKEALIQQGDKNAELQREAEEVYAGWKDLAPDDKYAQYAEVKADDPALAKRILSLREDEALGLGYEDRFVKRLQVSNGARAQYIFQAIEELETPGEKYQYWKDLKEKKLISETVALQIRALLTIQQGF